jgi:hypothetical protein
VSETKDWRCKTCRGSGQVDQGEDGYDCEECLGEGWVDDSKGLETWRSEKRESTHAEPSDDPLPSWPCARQTEDFEWFCDGTCAVERTAEEWVQFLEQVKAERAEARRAEQRRFAERMLDDVDIPY